MSEEVTRLDEFAAPFNKQITVMQVTYDNGFSMLRLRIREGHRFTIIDLDPVTARHWGELMSGWATAQPEG